MRAGIPGVLVSPRVLKRLVELEGFSVETEDDYNWALAKDGSDEIVIVPKSGTFVARDVCNAVFNVAPKAPRYFFVRRPSGA